jgi:ribosomal protein S18 acetylase RimI-like enzyme
MMTVFYAREPGLTASEFIDILNRSTLAERRPVDRLDQVAGMLRNASIIVTARLGGKLIGVSRAISDFSYCTFLSDLAVDSEFQRQGIGKELIRQTHLEAGNQTTLILLAAPKARAYYPAIGMTSHDSCWTFPPGAQETSPEAH